MTCPLKTMVFGNINEYCADLFIISLLYVCLDSFLLLHFKLTERKKVYAFGTMAKGS